MTYLKFKKNRYVHLLLMSIFFVSTLSAQVSRSTTFKDSVIAIRPFPKAKAALPLFEKINQLSIEDGNRNLELYSKVYMSYYNDVLGNSILSDEQTEEAYAFVKDTTGITIDNIIMAYQWMSQLERKRGNLINANDLNKRYIELELANGKSDLGIGISYLELASGYRILGDFENAILYPTIAIKLFKNAPDSLYTENDKYIRIWRALQIRGLANKDIKKFEEAINDYTLSLSYLKKSKRYNSPTGHKSRIKSYGRLAQVLLLNNDLTKADEALKKLDALRKPDPYYRCYYYELSTLLSLKREDLPTASLNISKAIEFSKLDLKGSKAYPDIARLNMIYGDYFVALGSLNKAIEKYHTGLQYFDENLDDNYSNNPEISQVPEGLQTLQILEKKAETFIKLYYQNDDIKLLSDGISTYNTAIDLIDKMKSDFVNEGSKYRVNEIASSIFPKALEANYILFELEKSESALNSIFNIIEKNKAEILFLNISSKYNLLASALPAKMIKKGIDLQYNISYYSKLLSEESQKPDANETKISKHKDKLFKLNEALTFQDQKIKDEYPEFYKFKNEIGTQISIHELKSNLKTDQLLIEYFQTEDHLYTISIRKEKAEVRRTSIDEITPNLSSFYKQISTRPATGNKNINEFNALSYALANQLILQDKNYSSNLSKIIIIPDGSISRIPFESLVIDESGKMLIEDCNISYNYSASQFLENLSSASLKNPKVLCLTPSFDGYTTEERTCNSSNLGDLPNIKKEYDYLKSNFSGSFFEGDLANSTNLEDNFSTYPIIHLATHACLNADDPMLSQIYFSDGAMTTYDIQNLNSRPELVVLSACNTASGRIQDGEGVIGLSRGFFEAGVKGLQSSLWSIDDYSSSEIVKRMYYHLQKGSSKSEALRLSKLDYLKTADKLRSHPYYWAALIHIGNDTPMHFTDNKLYWMLILLAIGIGIVGFYFYKKSN